MVTSTESFDMRPHLAVLLRQKYPILLFCLSASLSSLALTYVFSEKYVAYATVLYQPNEAVTFRPKDREALGFPTPAVSLESIGNTLDELVKSDAMLEHLVRTLHLDVKRPRPESNALVMAFRFVKDSAKEYAGNAWEMLRYGRLIDKNPVAEAMAALRRNLTIQRAAKAYTFRLLAVDNDPGMAATIVDTVADQLASLLEAERLRIAKANSQGLAVRLGNNEREIADLRLRLETFKKESAVSSLSEELSLKLKTVAGFREESSRSANDLQALLRRRAELQEQLERQEQLIKYDSTTTQNPIAEEMRLELAKLEVERSGLLGKFTEQHEEVRSLDARIAQARARLQTESTSVVSSESVRANEIYRKLLSDRLATDAEIASVRARLSAYDGSIGREQIAAQNLTSKEQQFADLTLQLEGAERSYVLINEAYEEARIAESRSVSEMSILHQAFVPSAPARPIKILHVGVTAGLSLVLAVGLVFFLNFFDTSIRRIDQVERVLNIPVLATIPKVDRAQIECRSP